VVLVGGETLRADAPRLDTRLVTPGDDCPSCDPVPTVVTARRTDAAWPGRAHIVLTSREPQQDGITPASLSGRRQAPPLRITPPFDSAVVVECEACEGGIDPASMVSHLADLGVRALLVEGGPRLAAAFLAAGLVDRWVAYTAPAVLGSGPGWPPETGLGTELSLTRVERCGPDVKAVWDRLPFGATCDRLSSADEAVRLAAGEDV
jgi:diaminohydroxyphosphoribosylaminopyrimidine deaminase/5-amino-6-(5-phosphoribosylamino)uracil reductase